MVEVFDLVRRCAESVDSLLSTFHDTMSVASIRVKVSKNSSCTSCPVTNYSLTPFSILE